MKILLPLALMTLFGLVIFAPLEWWDRVLMSRVTDFILFAMIGLIMFAIVGGAWWWALS